MTCILSRMGSPGGMQSYCYSIREGLNTAEGVLIQDGVNWSHQVTFRLNNTRIAEFTRAAHKEMLDHYHTIGMPHLEARAQLLGIYQQ